MYVDGWMDGWTGLMMNVRIEGGDDLFMVWLFITSYDHD